MAKITLEISDELYEQLAKEGDSIADLAVRLPELLALSQQPPAIPAHIYHYILDFISRNPTPQQIADFRPTTQMQERLKTLLARSKAEELTPNEQVELDEYERIEHLVIMIKSGNLRYLTSPT